MKKRRRRIYLTAADKAVMWDRWQKGDSLESIARFLIAAIPRCAYPAQTGGIRPRTRIGPADR